MLLLSSRMRSVHKELVHGFNVVDQNVVNGDVSMSLWTHMIWMTSGFAQ